MFSLVANHAGMSVYFCGPLSIKQINAQHMSLEMLHVNAVRHQLS
jgi:hypothetical protein